MNRLLFWATFLLTLVACIPAKAAEDANEEKTVSLDVSADVVSSYIWRGIDCAGFSVQPGATVSFPKVGISVGVWASAELFEKNQFANMSEFDLTASYSVGGFTVGVTDYTFCADKYFSKWSFNGNSSHNLEANLAYDFGPVALAWNTCLTGPDHQADGDRIYSTYVEVSAPFTLGGVDCKGSVGFLPWESSGFDCGMNADGELAHKFAVTNVALTANKEIFHLPLMASIIFNPYTEKTFFVVGLCF